VVTRRQRESTAGYPGQCQWPVFLANGFLLDGTENESAILGIAVVNPNIDSLQEFKVSTSNYDAEFGSAAGALIQATTKSGTKQWHGSLFEFLRNNFTNAADPFTSLNPPIRWNQFGGSVGAPIVKDKLFGFFDYQGTRRRTGGSLITTVPTAAERSGDLTGLLGSYICNEGSVSAGPCATPRRDGLRSEYWRCHRSRPGGVLAQRPGQYRSGRRADG
jgi:hypothetical protein